MNTLKIKAFFLDRDGVINHLKKNDYIKNISEFRFLLGVGKAISFLNKLKFKVIIVTNQACIGKSIITEYELNKIHKYMKKELLINNKATIDDIYFSPYYRYSKLKKYRLNKENRKPNIGLFKKAIKKWNIDIKSSFFIGDSVSDYEAAKKLNLKFYYKKDISLYKQIKHIISNNN